MRRDSQRSKLYRAERTLPETWGREHQLRTVEECRAFLHAVARRARVQAKWPSLARVGVRVEERRGVRAAALGWTVRVNPGVSSTKLILLHELAHVVMYATGHDAEQAHGWRYAETYLWLVREVLGLDVWSRLKAAFDGKAVKLRGKVRYRAPRKLSEAQRAAALANLERARAATRPPREGAGS